MRDPGAGGAALTMERWRGCPRPPRDWAPPPEIAASRLNLPPTGLRSQPSILRGKTGRTQQRLQIRNQSR
jgi:hypothetical protein